MFTTGPGQPDGPEETREYETVAVEAEEPVPVDEEPEIEEPEPTEEPEPVEDEGIEAGEDEPFDEEELEAVEDEAWEGDGYEDWDEDADETELIESVPQSEPQKSGTDDFKAWLVAFRQRAGTIWKGFWARIGAIKLPRHEIDGQKVLAVAGILAVAAMVGAGGYLLGKGSGDDVDQARLEGEFAGKRAGAVEGATKGYAAGFKRGRDQAFRKSYSASYKRNYIRAYSKAGMDAPKPQDIEVPKP
ncbi:MAG: hypothetical protein BGO23_01505 [Solirubrobacterales bacterium 67-14]|nr:MAG: hypothetical protein BGO23_01505 [Solirubrobacterales bacterium 67-14]